MTNIQFLLSNILILFIISSLYPQQKKQQLKRLNHGSLNVSIPNLVWKGMGYGSYEDGLSWFIDLGLTLPGVSGRDDYYDKSTNWSENTLGDSRVGSSKEYLMFDGGITISQKGFTYYLGGGFVWDQTFYEYYDSFEILGGNDGKYWVNGEKKTGINLCGELIIRSKSISWLNYFQVGFDTHPSQLVVGIGW